MTTYKLPDGFVLYEGFDRSRLVAHERYVIINKDGEWRTFTGHDIGMATAFGSLANALANKPIDPPTSIIAVNPTPVKPLEQMRWRADRKGTYYVSYPWVCMIIDTRDCHDNTRYETGDYFRTREEAEAAAPIIKEAIMKAMGVSI